MKEQKRAKRILKITAAFFLFFHWTVFSLVFRWPVTKWKKSEYDCAVVCGYPADRDGKPSKIMRTRVEKAAELWKDGKVKKLLFSGGAVFNSFKEAEVMKKYAEDLGVKEAYILTEDQAVSTYHNMMYAREIMEQNGLRGCAVVTNRWHLRKADHYARKFGMDYVMCPARNGERWINALYRWISTNVHMYMNLYRGYY